LLIDFGGKRLGAVMPKVAAVRGYYLDREF
jgi:hypothetical protein